MTTPDLINHPPHYISHPSGIEAIEITEHLNFALGNVVKYVMRAPYKAQDVDLCKAIWYLRHEATRRAREHSLIGLHRPDVIAKIQRVAEATLCSNSAVALTLIAAALDLPSNTQLLTLAAATLERVAGEHTYRGQA